MEKTRADGDLISRSALLVEINGEENARADGLMSEWYADMVERQPAIRAYTVEGVAELKQYREIGTVEECRTATEKQKPKDPNTWGVEDDEKIIYGGYGMYDCPNCGKSYDINYDKYDYCPNCGQAILWEGD